MCSMILSTVSYWLVLFDVVSELQAVSCEEGDEECDEIC